MSEEEKKAIKKLKLLNAELYIDNCNLVNQDDLKIALSLIEKQDEIINLMAGRIVELLEEKNITNHSKKDVIDIFKNLAVNNLLKEVKEDEI